VVTGLGFHPNIMEPEPRQVVLAKVAEVFPQEDPAAVLALLDTYGVEPYERERERVQLAVLKLSEGRLERLEEFVRVAKRDYRDALAWAEYPQETSYRVGALDETSLHAVRVDDQHQYLQWLRGGPADETAG
jgi:hypothetical protein